MSQKKLKNSTTRSHEKILLVADDISAFTHPLKLGFEKKGFEVNVFHTNKTTLMEKIVFALSPVDKLFWHLGNHLINMRLLKVTRRYKPNIFFVSKGKTVEKWTIENVKKINIITINWFSDWFEKTKFFSDVLPAYDFVFTADFYDAKKYKTSINVFHLPFGGKTLRKPNFSNRKYDLVFIGSYTRNRERLLSQLKSINLKIWGDKQWNKSALKHCYQREWLKPNDILNVYQKTKIAINHHQKKAKKRTTLNFRVFEATANGALVLTDFRKDLPKLFNIGKEVLLYRGKEELLTITEEYLINKNSRETIAKKGYLRTLREHNWDNRVEKILSIIKRSPQRKYLTKP